MKALAIALKTLVEIFREKTFLVILLGLPILFLYLSKVMAGNPSEGLASYLKVAVTNHGGSKGAQIVQEIRSLTYALEVGQEKPALEVEELDDSKEKYAQLSVLEGKVAAWVVIPEKLLPIDIYGDRTNPNYVFVRSFLDAKISERFVTHPVAQTVSFVPGTGDKSDFQASIPGVLVFAMALTVLTAASSVVRESSSGTLKRLRLSGVGAIDFFLGIGLAHFVLSVGLVPVLLIFAVWFGFVIRGALWLACFICVMMSMVGTGVGLFVGALSKSESEAGNIGAIAMVPMVLLSGSMFPMPEVVLFSAGSIQIMMKDVLPTFHAAYALKQVMIFEKGLLFVLPQLIALFLFAVLFIVCGAWVYSIKRMK